MSPDTWDILVPTAPLSRAPAGLLSPRAFAPFFLLAFFSSGCRDKASPDEAKEKAQKKQSAQKPARLYLPREATHDAPRDVPEAELAAADGVTFGPQGSGVLEAGSSHLCPPEMVFVGARFCIDRFEANLVDSKSGRALSPHYPPSKHYSTSLFERWSRKAPKSGRELGRNLAVPPPPTFQLEQDFSPRARSVLGAVPAAYLNRPLASDACTNAGKRLCRRDEWTQACRGESNTKFPYGNKYQAGLCNVHRQSHPARLVHGDASMHHLDPRLGLTADDDGPLLQNTGTSSQCASRWGNDAVYDMVGNVDEWIDDPGGAFLGGFFSRGTKEGCDASIDVHSPGYLDYSLGVRCCSDPT